jgi:hypothetical protein
MFLLTLTFLRGRHFSQLQSTTVLAKKLRRQKKCATFLPAVLDSAIQIFFQLNYILAYSLLILNIPSDGHIFVYLLHRYRYRYIVSNDCYK